MVLGAVLAPALLIPFQCVATLALAAVACLGGLALGFAQGMELPGGASATRPKTAAEDSKPKVKTFVPAEPRKKVPLWWIRGALAKVNKADFVQVQAAHLMLVLLFTFARSETPVAKAYTGDNAFDLAKQLAVEDVKVTHDGSAVWVRLKGIKQDPRMTRPSAQGNADWVVIGDIPDSDFSICYWTRLLFGFHGERRADKTSFYLARDRTRPYLYHDATKDIRALWAKVVNAPMAKTRGLHGLRVTGYDSARKGPEGVELAAAHGGWMSSAHRRYARFGEETGSSVVGLSRVIVEQLVEPGDDPLDDGHVPAPHDGDGDQGPTSIACNSRITVYWTEEDAWFPGTVRTQRREEPRRRGDKAILITGIRYDDAPSRLHRHDLDDEIWEYVDS